MLGLFSFYFRVSYTVCYERSDYYDNFKTGDDKFSNVCIRCRSWWIYCMVFNYGGIEETYI